MKKLRVVAYFLPMGFFMVFIFTSNLSIVYQGNEPKTFKLIVNVNTPKTALKWHFVLTVY